MKIGDYIDTHPDYCNYNAYLGGMKEFFILKEYPNYKISEDGTIISLYTGKTKSQHVGSTGYYMVSLSHEGKSRPQRVHRLLASMFISNPEKKPEVNHVDGNKLNNSLDNLEWVTHEENMRHAFSTGLANNTGSKNGLSKLKEKDIPIIRQLLTDGVSQYKIAREFNVSRSAILNIKIRGAWSHVK